MKKKRSARDKHIKMRLENEKPCSLSYSSDVQITIWMAEGRAGGHPDEGVVAYSDWRLTPNNETDTMPNWHNTTNFCLEINIVVAFSKGMKIEAGHTIMLTVENVIITFLFAAHSNSLWMWICSVSLYVLLFALIMKIVWFGFFSLCASTRNTSVKWCTHVLWLKWTERSAHANGKTKINNWKMSQIVCAKLCRKSIGMFNLFAVWLANFSPNRRRFQQKQAQRNQNNVCVCFFCLSSILSLFMHNGEINEHFCYWHVYSITSKRTFFREKKILDGGGFNEYFSYWLFSYFIKRKKMKFLH